MVDHLTSKYGRENIGIAHAYCNSKQSEKTAIALIQHLTGQLTGQLPPVPGTPLERMTNELEEQSRQRVTQALEDYIVHLTMMMPGFTRVFIVIDGLDEWPATEASRFLRGIQGMLMESKLSLFITSQSSTTLVEDIAGCSTLDLCHDSENIVKGRDEDIRRMVDSILMKHSLRFAPAEIDHQLRDRIIDVILRKSAGR